MSTCGLGSRLKEIGMGIGDGGERHLMDVGGAGRASQRRWSVNWELTDQGCCENQAEGSDIKLCSSGWVG